MAAVRSQNKQEMSKFFTFSFVLVFPFFSLGQDWKKLNTDDPMLRDLKSALAEMETIQGDIQQEKSFAFLTNKLVSTGTFKYQNNDRLRWEFTEPMEYIILINGNSMRLREDGAEKKYKGVDRILRQVKEIILGCIDGSIMSNSNYRTDFSSNGDRVRIQLQPKAKDLKEFIQQIDVQFQLTGSVLKQVSLTDPSGDVTDIYFSNVLNNRSIDESVFADF